MASPVYGPPKCKTERARNIIPVFSCQDWEMGVTSPDFWLLSADHVVQGIIHTSGSLWNGTEELSFWRSNYFLLNLCINVSLWEEFIYEILTLSPECLSLRVSCWPAFYSFFSLYGAEHPNACKPPNYLKIEITITVFCPLIPGCRRNILKEKIQKVKTCEMMIVAELSGG